MLESENPFVGSVSQSQSSEPAPAPPTSSDPILGDALEAEGVAVPTGAQVPAGTPLGVRDVDPVRPGFMWVLATHGGAGASTLASLTRTRDFPSASIRRWPRPRDGSRAPVLLVARTHAQGLQSAQRAATEWAANYVPWVDLLGLVLVADGPKPHPDLRVTIKQTMAMVPHTWTLGWQQSWRALTPQDTRSMDLRTKHTIGRIRRSLAKTQGAAAPSTTSEQVDIHHEGARA